MFSRSGQAEILIIVGVIVIIVAVLAYTFGASLFERPVPPAIKNDQMVVMEFVENIITDKAYETVIMMERNGGYIDGEVVPSGTTVFMNNGVAYWQKCENTYPSATSKTTIQNKMNNRIKNEVVSDLENIVGTSGTGEINGKEVKIRYTTANVLTNIVDNKVEITMDMITEVSGYEIREPFTISIPTNFGRILKFAEDFSVEQRDDRFFEMFTRYNIEFFSDLPRVGFLMGCDNTIFISPEDLEDKLNTAINDVVYSTSMWEESAIDGYTLYFGVDEVNDNLYEDLEAQEPISFWLPDDFLARVYRPVLIYNTGYLLTAEALPLSTMCSGYYEQTYSLSYPVIVRVHDSVLDTYFQFAVFVDIDEMENGVCGEDVEEVDCSEAASPMDVTLVDGNGDPLEGANVFVAGCYVGETDANGVVSGLSVSGSHELVIYPSDNHEMVIVDITVPGTGYTNTFTSYRVPESTYHFVHAGGTCTSENDVNTEFVAARVTTSLGQEFSISNALVGDDIDSCLQTSNGHSICTDCYNSGDQNSAACQDCTAITGNCITGQTTSYSSISYIPAGTYTIEEGIIMNVGMMNSQTDSYKRSIASVPVTLGSSTITIPEEDAHINVYVPNTDQVYQLAFIKYDIRKNNKKCLAKILGVCVQHESAEAARGAAIADAINFIKGHHPTLYIEVC